MRGVLLFLDIRRPLNRIKLCDKLLLRCKIFCFPSIVISSRLRYRDFEISTASAHDTSHRCVVQSRQRRKVLLQQSLARCQTCRIVWTWPTQRLIVKQRCGAVSINSELPFQPPKLTSVRIQCVFAAPFACHMRKRHFGSPLSVMNHTTKARIARICKVRRVIANM